MFNQTYLTTIRPQFPIFWFVSVQIARVFNLPEFTLVKNFENLKLKKHKSSIISELKPIQHIMFGIEKRSHYDDKSSGINGTILSSRGIRKNAAQEKFLYWDEIIVIYLQ